MLDTEVHIGKLTRKVLKNATLFVMMFIGIVFALIGISEYLAANYGLVDGVGYIIVGLILFLLGWFGEEMRK